MINRILVPLDGSRLAEAVLPYVEDLGRRLSAKVQFVRVIELSSAMMMGGGEMAAPDPVVMEEALASEEAEAREYLSALAGVWQKGGIESQWEVIQGMPAQSIIDIARSQGVDLIAMSTHGRSGLGRLVFGSVADQVMREAGIPMLLVKPAQEGTETAPTAREQA